MGWLSQHVHLGDLPTWLAAIGAAIAAWFAFGQLRALRAQNRLQQHQLDATAKDVAQVEATQRKQAELLDLDIRERRAAQARLIKIRRPVLPWQDPGSGVQNGYTQVLRVTNNSHGSISNLDACFAPDGETPHRAIYSAVPEITERAPGWWAPGNEELGHVPADRLDIDQTIDLIGPTYDQQNAERTHGHLLFTDSDGRRWKINHTGQLSEIDPNQSTES